MKRNRYDREGSEKRKSLSHDYQRKRKRSRNSRQVNRVFSFIQNYIYDIGHDKHCVKCDGLNNLSLKTEYLLS